MKLVKIAIVIIVTSFLFPLEAIEGLFGMVYYKRVYPTEKGDFETSTDFKVSMLT